MLNLLFENLGLIFAVTGILLMIGLLIVIPFSDYFKKKKLEKIFKESTIHNQQGWKKRRELSETRKQSEAKLLSVIENKYSDFLKSSEKRYIERFAEKLGDKMTDSELSKLQFILKEKQWDFSVSDLKLLIEGEIKKQKLKSIKFNFLGYSGKSHEEIIKVYLANFSCEDEIMLEILREVLKERGLSFNNLENLKKEVIQVKLKIEAEEFENFLLNDNPPPDKPVVEPLLLEINSDESSLH